MKLGEIVKIRYGLSQPPEEDENGIPMIRATNIKKGKIWDNGILRVNGSAIPKSSDLHLRGGEVIIVRSGAYTGDVGHVSMDWQEYNDRRRYRAAGHWNLHEMCDDDFAAGRPSQRPRYLAHDRNV